jgi:hypothetical protein
MNSDRYHSLLARYRLSHRQVVVVGLALAAALMLCVGLLLGRRFAFTGIGMDPQPGAPS